MPAAGFETAISASEPPQTRAVDSAATGIGARASVKEFTYHILAPSEWRSCRPFLLTLRLQKKK